MKKFAALFMSVVLMCGLAACGSREAAPSQPAGQTGTTASSASETPSATAETSAATQETSSASTRTPGSSRQTGAAGTTSRRTSAPAASASTSSNPPASEAATTSSTAPRPETTATSTVQTQPTASPSDSKTLVVYFSWSSAGNTERMANYIRDAIGAELYEIQPAQAYPTDYTACTEVALEERDSNARPAILNPPASLEQYDRLFIGFPIWWHTAPMIIGTFLESYDLTGMDIYPFTQSASMDDGQFRNAMDFVRDCAPNASVHDGLFERPADTAAIDAYLSGNGF